jgi:hypothetical protein
MNDIFQIEIAQGHVLIYLEDILIFSKDLDQHHRQVRHVMEILHEHRMYLKPEKCQFDVLETEYLGMIISEGKIQMDPVKVAGIAEWPTLRNKRELRFFLGLVGRGPLQAWQVRDLVWCHCNLHISSSFCLPQVDWIF